jgi:5-methylcytosine-specific restriction endonuclease McrA
MRAKLTKEEMMERIKFYEENGEVAFTARYNCYWEVIYTYRKKLGLRGSHKVSRTNKLPKLYSCSKFVNFTKEDKIKFIEYYKTHTSRDTAKQYSISTSYATRSAKSFNLEIYSKPFHKRKYNRKVKLTKEEMMKRIKFYEENGEAALKNKYKVGKASIRRYRCIINKTNGTNSYHMYRTDAEKRKMIEYYKAHTGKETAIKYGLGINSTRAAVSRFADEIGYPKPLKYRTNKRAIDKKEMLERIKFYEENGIEKYTDKYGYHTKSTAQSSIFQYCKRLRYM